MTTKALLVRLSAKPGMDDEVEEFLHSALEPVLQEPETTAWFAVRFGRGDYGIFDAFPDDRGRQTHLSGPVAHALRDTADELLAAEPEIHALDVLADKLPESAPADEVRKGLLLTFAPKTGNEDEVAQFLREARAIVEQEPGTIAWFAVRMDDGRYGIFDAFPDDRSRFAHLVGRVPRELAKHGLELLGGVPDVDGNGVLASKLPA
jgi:quinol monooxygenase YgiN